MANNGRVILMAIENERSWGGMDLFVSFLQADWTWSIPRNCGNVINTFANEMTPFLAADDKTLYFSSYGHQGFGSADVFVTKRLDDTWMNWSEPVNVGMPINGPAWDAYFKVDAKAEYGYLVSSGDQGYGKEDIYRVQLADEIRPEEVVYIYGKVFDRETGNELSAKVYFEDLHINSLLGEGHAQKGSGYAITLPKGRLYGFQAALEGYIPMTETIDLHELSTYKSLEVNLYVTPIKDQQVFELTTLEVIANEVVKTAHYELDQLAELLLKNKSLVIDLGTIKAIQNSTPVRTKNAVKKYLTDKGVNTKQLIVDETQKVVNKAEQILMILK